MDSGDSDEKTPPKGTPSRHPFEVWTGILPDSAAQFNSPEKVEPGRVKTPSLPTSAQSFRPPHIPRPDSTGKQIIAPPPRRDNTGKQGVAPLSEKRAPPPVAKMVSFSPPAPARTGNTNPGGLQTRVDSPHPKQKTPRPQAPPLAPPSRAAPPSLHTARLDTEEENTPPSGVPLGPAVKTGPGASRPPKIPERGPAPGKEEPRIPNLRQIPSYSRFSFLFPDSPLRMAIIWGIITLAALAPIAIGVARCQSDNEPYTIEQKETQKKEEPLKKAEEKPKPAHSSYIPKALRKPPAPQIRNVQGIPRARNSLRA